MNAKSAPLGRPHESGETGTSITAGHVLAVKCKTCRARPGQPCRLRWPARNPKWPFHADRLDRALARHRKVGLWPRGGRRG